MLNVAIDGPAGAGKSSVARAAAAELGFIYVDTGALYRAVGVYALRSGIPTKDAEALAEALPKIRLELKFEDGVQHIFLNGEDVSEEIRLPAASMAASDVSAVPAVRAFLLNLQRGLAEKHDCIMDGRDIGTVILPKAQVKIFLTASQGARAERRRSELREKGISESYEKVLAELRVRDEQDSHREIAPLRPAEDGILLDTTYLTLKQSVRAVVQIIREKKRQDL